MTNWFTSIFSGGVDKVVDSVSKGLDELFTSDEERLLAKNLVEREMNNFKLQMQDKSNEYEETITKRWSSDNDNFLTRSVRPISYYSMLVLFFIIVLFDGNVGGFTINSAYIPVIEALLVTMTIAYFGSRGAEKIGKIFKGKSNEQG